MTEKEAAFDSMFPDLVIYAINDGTYEHWVAAKSEKEAYDCYAAHIGPSRVWPAEEHKFTEIRGAVALRRLRVFDEDRGVDVSLYAWFRAHPERAKATFYINGDDN